MDQHRKLLDTKEYANFTLDNGIEVVCISDTRQDDLERTAAIAVAVGVGCFSDPREVQGMAHYLEHM